MKYKRDTLNASLTLGEINPFIRDSHTRLSGTGPVLHLCREINLIAAVILGLPSLWMDPECVFYIMNLLMKAHFLNKKPVKVKIDKWELEREDEGFPITHTKDFK